MISLLVIRLMKKLLVGSAGFGFRKYHNKTGFYLSNYLVNASSFHFQKNSRYSSITPSVVFGWRPDDFRSDRRDFLRFRHVNIFRSIGEGLERIRNST